jgi:hypothetical protein
MTQAQAKKEAIDLRIAEAIARATEYDRRGDVVLRNQVIREMYDLPQSVEYIKAAITAAGLPTNYSTAR